LVCACLPGDGWRLQHDAIKWRLDADMREMGIRARTEVYGLFASALPQQARSTVGTWTVRKRQGLVPDFRIALPAHNETPTQASDELFELKTLHYGSSTYPDAQADTRRGAAKRRADALPAEYAAKARRLDSRFSHTPAGAVGPVERRLLSFGPVRGLVFGHWAEGTAHVDDLLAGCARAGAEMHWRGMRAREPADALGTLTTVLRRRWGLAAWRAAARLLLGRLEYVGHGAIAGHARRHTARDAAALERRCEHWLFRRRAHA
jgi:hypothetical protein